MTYDLSGLSDLYPFASHHLSLDGVRMHYLDEGHGPPMVMLHGNPTWSFYYRELIRAFRDDYRVIVPDHIGCGLSDKPQDYPYTLATHIENLERLMSALQLREVTLVMHDWGGAIGFGWAARHADLVRRLVVFNTSAFTGPCALRIRICRAPLLGALAIRGFNLFARSALTFAVGNRSRITPAIRRGYLLPYDNWANRIATLRFVQDIPIGKKAQSYPVLCEIERSLERFADRPMLICWGAKDFCFNDWFLDEWIRRFPQAMVHRFEDAGHYVVEDAHERIVPAMRAWMDSH